MNYCDDDCTPQKEEREIMQRYPKVEFTPDQPDQPADDRTHDTGWKHVSVFADTQEDHKGRKKECAQ